MAVCRGDGGKPAVRWSAERAEVELVILTACPLPREGNRVSRRPISDNHTLAGLDAHEPA